MSATAGIMADALFLKKPLRLISLFLSNINIILKMNYMCLYNWRNSVPCNFDCILLYLCFAPYM